MANQNLREISGLEVPTGLSELSFAIRLDVSDDAQLRSVVADLHRALPDEKWRAMVRLAQQILDEHLEPKGLLTVFAHQSD